MAAWALIVFGPFCVIQYQTAVCQAMVASFFTRSGLLSRSMPSASPAAL